MEQPVEPDLRLLGLSLSGPPPIGQFHTRWKPGLHVLYGKNGAGKSAILNGIRSALQGTGGEGWLHFIADDPREPLDWEQAEDEGEGLGHKFVANLNRSMEQHLFYPGIDPDDANESSDTYESVMRSGSVGAAIEGALTGLGRAGELAAELSQQGLLSLRSTGREEQPGWELWISGLPTAEAPSVREYVSFMTEVSVELLDVLELRPWTIGGHLLNQAQGEVVARFVGQRFWERAEKDASVFSSEDFVVGSFPLLWAGSLPGWVPVPLARIGSIDDLGMGLPRVLVESTGDLNRETLETLYYGGGIKELEIFLVAGTVAAEEMSVTVRNANSVLESVLLDAPTLSFDPPDADDLFGGHFGRWLAVDRPTLSTVTVEELSQAQSRWAALSIRWVLAQWEGSADHVALIDEPEQALHPTAVRHLVGGLNSLAATSLGPVFVATHSPMLIDDLDSTLVHIHRNTSTGLATGVPLEEAFRAGLGEAADTLGLTAAAVLQQIRLFLIVEGQRDVEMLRGFFGDEFDANRILVLPMHGTGNLSSVIDSKLIFDYTSASLLVAIDNLRLPSLMPAWEQARDEAKTGGGAKARRLLEKLSNLSREEKAVVEFMKRALVPGRQDRIRVHPLSEPDGIYYLPPGNFVSGASSWNPIRAEYEATRKRRSAGGYEDMKTWLRREKGSNTSVTAFGKAARSMEDAIPDELGRLYSLALGLATGRERSGDS